MTEQTGTKSKVASATYESARKSWQRPSLKVLLTEHTATSNGSGGDFGTFS